MWIQSNEKETTENMYLKIERKNNKKKRQWVYGNGSLTSE